MKNIIATDQLTKQASYFGDVPSYFAAFDPLWDSVEGQVIKLETRQTYREPGNPSFDALESGNFNEAIRLLPESREGDVELYRDLETRKVEFIRCRPIIAPLTNYLKWEMECYKFNSAHGEKIFFCNWSDLFEEYAKHDFIVFDRSGGVIHNYDDSGVMRGGWLIEDRESIDCLNMIFSLIKSTALDYLQYLRKNNIVLT